VGEVVQKIGIKVSDPLWVEEIKNDLFVMGEIIQGIVFGLSLIAEGWLDKESGLIFKDDVFKEIAIDSMAFHREFATLMLDNHYLPPGIYSFTDLTALVVGSVTNGRGVFIIGREIAASFFGIRLNIATGIVIDTHGN